MCNNRIENKCKITNDICPWTYWCGKLSTYKEREGMDKYCKYKQQVQVPDGYNLVKFERNGFLYVDIDSQTIKLCNPYSYVPQYVKVYKYRGEWRIKKEG